jgi:hypothetical protein
VRGSTATLDRNGMSWLLAMVVLGCEWLGGLYVFIRRPTFSTMSHTRYLFTTPSVCLSHACCLLTITSACLARHCSDAVTRTDMVQSVVLIFAFVSIPSVFAYYYGDMAGAGDSFG